LLIIVIECDCKWGFESRTVCVTGGDDYGGIICWSIRFDNKNGLSGTRFLKISGLSEYVNFKEKWFEWGCEF
jgi:hypothetical protein